MLLRATSFLIIIVENYEHNNDKEGLVVLMYLVVQLFPSNRIHFYFCRHEICLLKIVAWFQKRFT